MKKLYFIILSVTLTLALCACGSPFKAACKLLDEGKYDEAITTFEQLEPSEQVEEKLAHARQMKFQQEYDKACKLMDEEKYDEAIAAFEQLEKTELVELKLSQAKDAKYRVMYADYFGEWVSGGRRKIISLGENKQGKYTVNSNTEESSINLQLEFDEQGIREIAPEERPVELESFNGVPCLLYNEMRFFRAEDIDKVIEAVEITPENFWEYFELSPWYLGWWDDQKDEEGVPVPYTIEEIDISGKYQNRFFNESALDLIFKTKVNVWNFVATWTGDGYTVDKSKHYDFLHNQPLEYHLVPEFFSDSQTMNLLNLDTLETYAEKLQSIPVFRVMRITSAYIDCPTIALPDMHEIIEITEASGTLLLYREAPQS